MSTFKFNEIEKNIDDRLGVGTFTVVGINVNEYYNNLMNQNLDIKNYIDSKLESIKYFMEMIEEEKKKPISVTRYDAEYLVPASKVIIDKIYANIKKFPENYNKLINDILQTQTSYEYLHANTDIVTNRVYDANIIKLKDIK